MPYYEYRTLTPQQRAEIVRERLSRGYPPHSPPHPVRDQPYYLLTAACYNHVAHLHTPERRRQVLDALFQMLTMSGLELRAWAILPNHYHLLVAVNDFAGLPPIIRIVHGSTTHQWNAEDSRRGRRVWYRYTDRAIRSERHYYVTLNYIHYNPVKHRWATSPYEWAESSVHWYLERKGREWLRDLWMRYPVRLYGRDWDDFPGAPADDAGVKR